MPYNFTKIQEAKKYFGKGVLKIKHLQKNL